MNRIKAEYIETETCPCVGGRASVAESCAAYLQDESRLASGDVAAVYFPENTAQVVDAVRKASADGDKIIVSGARTGITGGAVGLDGTVLLSLERMDQQLGDLRFGAGVKLEDIPDYGNEYYPVDPTETTASLGGTVATDASGARTLYYGSTRKFVKSLTVVLADGAILRLNRGEVICEDGEFVIETPGGERGIPVRDVYMPPVKNTAGYYLRSGMDMVDLFVGSEGTLGIVTEVEIYLAPKPADRLFLVVFTKEEGSALELVDKVKADEGLDPLAIEYFDPNALELVRNVENAANIPSDAGCAVYLELVVKDEDFEERLDAVLSDCGLDMDSTWAGFDEKDLREMKEFRHLVPETVNQIIGSRKAGLPDLHKIGTDTAVPDGKLREFLGAARKLIEEQGLEYVVFGHIGDNHLHINMMPSSMEELDRARELYVGIAELSVRLGGSVSAEHGIGRLKRRFMGIQFDEGDIEAMRAVKKALDPDGLLGPGIMFEE